MKAHAYIFGHPVYASDGCKWKWCDTGEIISRNPDKTARADGRDCPKCGLAWREDGIDPCLGKLSGVRAACCGHGIADDRGYIAFESGKVIRFNEVEIDD